MRYCIKCNKVETNCCCNTAVSNTTINSDAAGRDGFSTYDIAVRTGKFTGTEAQFVEWNRGPKGDPGEDGGGVYLTTEW